MNTEQAKNTGSEEKSAHEHEFIYDMLYFINLYMWMDDISYLFRKLHENYLPNRVDACTDNVQKLFLPWAI